jgi:lysozyme
MTVTTVGPKGIALIKQYEGCRLKAYPDPASGGDPWTIGYGSTGPGIEKGVEWTQAQCEARLAQDAPAFSHQVLALIGNVPTTQEQLDALTSFAYNEGLGNLKKSTLLKLHKAGDYAGAAKQFAVWNKADGKVMAGLITRRAAEARLYLGSTPQHTAVVFNTPKLNVRAAPNTSGAVLTQLAQGSVVTVVQNLGEWSQVEYVPGKRGYASNQFLKPE